ncbi:cobalt-precorrin-7 (C(5))-methyltransferase [Halovivax limisalsi]|uniref:cobalt-precorrin-7 (C(5))-methyltransferase n=1 Tax=Halovivax limisalsi TaxID=1453760 RepID=UPI001FFC96DA|nr:cobalt-precorrin-7 (C(5))-methyltransferase [Halovivax limisalsi]
MSDDLAPDPATIAAASAERTVGDAGVREGGTSGDADGAGATDGANGDPVYAVGIGPGNPDYLTPRGERAIRDADVVVGFDSVVAYVAELAPPGTELLTCGYDDEGETLAAFADRVADGVAGTAVLMGDPNHSGYQFIGRVQRAVEAAAPARPIRVIPGISSLQVAASRARTPMEDSEFVTLHKRGDLEGDLARLARAVGERHLLVLPRPFDWMPGDIADFLLDEGADPALDALVCEKLTHDDEAIHRFTLAELATHAGGDGRDGTPFSDLSVLVVRRPVEIE